jgi:hypothetical protein
MTWTAGIALAVVAFALAHDFFAETSVSGGFVSRGAEIRTRDLQSPRLAR